MLPLLMLILLDLQAECLRAFIKLPGLTVYHSPIVARSLLATASTGSQGIIHLLTVIIAMTALPDVAGAHAQFRMPQIFLILLGYFVHR